MTTWSTAYVNSLPDSSFAWIDSDGNRHLPYKDANGKIDHNHTANALERLNQVQGMSSEVRAKVKAKLESAMKKVGQMSLDADKMSLTASPIQLDSDGNLPTKFPLFVTGDWKNSVKGNFKVTLDHLKEMKDHYDNGIGFPTDDASTGLAIDFKHEYRDLAAAWIKGLELEIDPVDPTKGTLYSNPTEWTEAGARAIKSGEFKCVSPMGSFGERNGKLSMWSNPTNLKEQFANVLEGAGLTNIPFLRGMAPIRASVIPDDDEEYDKVNKDNNKEIRMNLDTLRVKDAEDLTGAEYKFVAEHRSELSADEKAKFSLETADADRTELSAEDKTLLDSIKAGDKKVVDADSNVVDKSTLDRLEKTAQDYREDKVRTVLATHVKRGAIKQDQAKLDGFWGKQLLSAEDDARKEVEKALDALPSNEDIGKENGTAEDALAGSTARDQLAVIASEKVAKAAEAGKEMLYSDALREAIRENSLLTKQDKIEQGA